MPNEPPKPSPSRGYTADLGELKSSREISSGRYDDALEKNNEYYDEDGARMVADFRDSMDQITSIVSDQISKTRDLNYISTNFNDAIQGPVATSWMETFKFNDGPNTALNKMTANIKDMLQTNYKSLRSSVGGPQTYDLNLKKYFATVLTFVVDDASPTSAHYKRLYDFAFGVASLGEPYLKTLPAADKPLAAEVYRAVTDAMPILDGVDATNAARVERFWTLIKYAADRPHYDPTQQTKFNLMDLLLFTQYTKDLSIKVGSQGRAYEWRYASDKVDAVQALIGHTFDAARAEEKLGPNDPVPIYPHDIMEAFMYTKYSITIYDLPPRTCMERYPIPVAAEILSLAISEFINPVALLPPTPSA